MRMIARLAAAMVIAIAAAGHARAADATFPPGSKIGLVPPGGFVPSDAFRGFEDRVNSSAILTLEMPAEAYQAVEKAMTADALKKQGVIVEKREPFTLKNGKAVLIIGRQQSEGTKLHKWILLASTADVTALVTVLVPDAASNVYPNSAVRDALATLTVRPAVPMDEQLGLLPFKLDDLAGLHAFRVVEPSTVFLTSGAKDTIAASEQPLFVVSAARGGPENAPERDIFARNLFSTVGGYKDLRIVGSDVIRLAGMQTHELMAEAEDADSGTPVRLVQWIRFGNGAFMRFLGVARADAWTEAFPRFRAVRDGVTPR